MKNNPTSKEAVAKIRELGLSHEIEFYFVPSTELLNRIARGGDPILDKLPKLAKEIFLGLPQGKGIALYSPMVLKYLEGSLDYNNTYVFDMGEIRIRNYGDIVIKCLNQSKKKSPK